ncbi:hypothetical protein D3C86_2146690 [compost metagenome]
MMNRMGILPLLIRNMGNDTKNGTEYIICLTVPKERLMAAVMKQDEGSDHKPGSNEHNG